MYYTTLGMSVNIRVAWEGSGAARAALFNGMGGKKGEMRLALLVGTLLITSAFVGGTAHPENGTAQGAALFSAVTIRQGGERS
jgi:hypothetical protein